MTDVDQEYLDRWTLVVEFDPPGANEEMLLGESAEFYGVLLRAWGEESEEDITWKDDVVIVHASNTQYLYDPMQWLLSNTVPRSLSLTRNEPRDTG